MPAHREHRVTFYSPGTFCSEQTTRPIESWEPKAAACLARGIVERYDATPYAFVFSTVLVADPVPDGEGGKMSVEPKKVARSGLYFIKGALLTVADVEARERAEPGRWRILASNMRGNNWPVVVETLNGYRHTTQFTIGKDCIVDEDGNVTDRGEAHAAPAETKET